jgi:hypothetical protein
MKTRLRTYTSYSFGCAAVWGRDPDRHADPGGLSHTDHVSAGLSRMVDRMAVGHHRPGCLSTPAEGAVGGRHHLRPMRGTKPPTDALPPPQLLISRYPRSRCRRPGSANLSHLALRRC